MRRLARGSNDRGFVLITTLMVISLLMVYNSLLTLRTLTQQRAADVMRSRNQSVDLAQGAVEQMRENLYSFLINDIQMPVGINACSGDASCALAWLDALGASINGGDGPAPIPEFSTSTAIIGLPTIQATNPTAQIVKIVTTNAADPLAPRRMTINGTATVNGLTKHVQATYDVKLEAASIFRYGYFLNNYGWIENTSGGSVTINGEMRSNGDLTFAGSGVSMNGDLYASKNPALGMDGLISGNPKGWWPSSYWYWRDKQGRTARQLSLFGTPPSKVLPLGLGYDITLNTGMADPNRSNVTPRRYERQPMQPIPYLGNLDRYKSLAQQYKKADDSIGGYLKWTDPGPDNLYEWWGQGGDLSDPPPDDVYTSTPITDGVYKGPDGVAGTADDTKPLVIIGSPRRPIVIDGPVVIPGDVVIRGQITGRGTIYAGRNIQVVDGVAYKNKPNWPTIERDVVTGQVRERCVSESWKRESNLGTVCKDGTFYPKGAALPAGCML